MEAERWVLCRHRVGKACESGTGAGRVVDARPKQPWDHPKEKWKKIRGNDAHWYSSGLFQRLVDLVEEFRRPIRLLKKARQPLASKAVGRVLFVVPAR